jgi:flagellar protein FlbD
MEPMIVVTRLNDSQFAINPDLIERINSNPDTTLVMVDGAKYIVTESMDEVIEAIASYRAHVLALAYETQPASGRTGVRQLGLVSSPDGVDGDFGAPDGGNTVPLRPRRK